MRFSRLLVVCALILTPIAGMPLSTAPTGPPVSGAESGSPGVVVQPINTSVSHLAIKPGRINNTTIATVTLDMSAVVTIDRYRFKRRYRIERFDAAYENASNPQTVVSAALNRSENQTAALRERQKRIIADYNANEISTQKFLHELANISAKAEQTSLFVEHIKRKTLKFDNRANNIRGNLRAFSGPVRTDIESALQGKPTAPKRFFIRTSAAGIVLSTIDDGQYIREVYLGGARSEQNDTQPNNRYKITNMIEKSYPTINDSTIDLHGYNSYFLYEFNVFGGILTYTDRSSMEIFYERQRMTVSDDRTVRGPQNTSGPFALTTNVSYPGGYMYVNLTDPETGETLNGTITVGNETIGATDGGKLYMLQPSEATIKATVDNKTVTVTLGRGSTGPPGPPPKAAIDTPLWLMEADQRRVRREQG